MLRQLQPLLSHRDKIGYVAARNYRVLSDALTEYELFRQSLIEKYGEEYIKEDGTSEIRIKMDTPAFRSFCDEIAPFDSIEHEVELMTTPFTDAIGHLSGEEILSIDWMLTEEG